MAYNKRTWLGRQGTGLNKFSIGGASPVTIVNQPDSVTQVGDALSAGNLNDLEDRIEDAFDETASQSEVTNLNNAMSQLDHRVSNLEQAKGDYVVANYKDGAITPSGKGNWAVVEGVRGQSRVENGLAYPMTDSTKYNFVNSTGSMADGVATFTASAFRGGWGQSTSFKTLPSMGGRTVLIALDIKTTTATTDVRLYAYGGYATKNCVASTAWQTVMMLVNVDASWPEYDRVNNRLLVEDTRQSGWDAIQTKNLVMCDLSVYFGGTIPSDADTIAKIQTNYPHLLLPSEYGQRIVDLNCTGVRAWGKNLIELNPITATGDSTNNSVYNTHYFPDSYKPNTQYVLSAYISANNISYSSTGNLIFAEVYYSDGTMGYGSVVTSSNYTQSRVEMVTASGKTVVAIGLSKHQRWTGGNIALSDFQLEIGSSATSYSPYMENTLSLTYTGKSAGSVYDSCEVNVEVEGVARKRTTQRVGVMTFNGTENWLKSGSSGAFYVTMNSATFPYKFASDVQALSRYVFLGTGAQSADVLANADDAFGLYYLASSTVREVWFKDTSFATTDAWKTHLAQNPLILYYELADPVVTLSDPIIDNTLLTEAGGRLSTVQTGTIVDGTSELGFITL